MFQQPSEPVPHAGGHPTQLGRWVQFQVEHHQGEIAIAQEQVGRLQRFHRIPASHPQQARHLGRLQRLHVEAVRTVHQGDETSVGRGLAHDGMENLGGAGARAGTDEFGQSALGKTTGQSGIQCGYTGGHDRDGSRFRHPEPHERQALPEELAEFDHTGVSAHDGRAGGSRGANVRPVPRHETEFCPPALWEGRWDNGCPWGWIDIRGKTDGQTGAGCLGCTFIRSLRPGVFEGFFSRLDFAPQNIIIRTTPTPSPGRPTTPDTLCHPRRMRFIIIQATRTMDLPTRTFVSWAVLGLAAVALRPGEAAAQNAFRETDLVSDIPGRAAVTDPSLSNPWGIAFSPTSPFWVSDNHTGVATLYNGFGQPFPLANPLVVTVPPPGGGSPPSAPTGMIFNGGAAFNGDRFIFASEDGTIAGWRGALGSSAEILADNSAAGSIYKGLAVATIGANTYLYASDFHNGNITVFPSSGAPALAGSFTDPNLPAGYAPFNIQNIGGRLYVTYALQDAAKTDDDHGPGRGFVDVFDLNGNLVQRLVSNGALNSPWGLAIAPAGFGPFAGDLLVGNFGDGRINAYDPNTGNLIDPLKDFQGNPIEIDGLWALTFGNGGNGGDQDKLYFTAGLSDEDHGLFGKLAVPEGGPGTGPLLGIGLVALIALRTGRMRINLPL